MKPTLYIEHFAKYWLYESMRAKIGIKYIPTKFFFYFISFYKDFISKKKYKE